MTGMIVAQVVTDQHTDDPSQVGPLLAQVEGKVTKVTADGAYDGAATYRTIAQYGAEMEGIIPPRQGAVAGSEMGPLKQRDRHVEMLQREGRIGAKSHRIWATSAG